MPQAVDLGTRLSGRYRLERRLGEDMPGSSRWEAVDELLNRPVMVTTLAADSTQTTAVMSAARQASQLEDPRLLRILDAGDEGCVWVERALEASTLAELLATGPLAPREAAYIAAQVAAGLAAAHAAGMTHGCLRPEHVLRTESGQVKVSGLGVDAAAHTGTINQASAPLDGAGQPPGPRASDQTDTTPISRAAAAGHEAAVAVDTAACAAVLYAGLTGRWPLPGPTAVPSAPEVDGQLCSPRQVRGGVPPELDEIACRGLPALLRSRPGSALRSPAAVAAALAPAALGESGATAALPVTPDAEDTPGPFAAPAHPGRTGRTVRAIAWVVLVVGLALAAWQLVLALNSRAESSPTPSTRASGSAASGSRTPIGSAPVEGLLKPVGISDFDPEGDGSEHPDQVGRAIDGNAATAWQTQVYFHRPDVGGAKRGVGLLIDLGTTRRISTVSLQLQGRGTSLELRVAASRAAGVDGYTVLKRVNSAGTAVTTTFPATPARYLLVWLTRLPRTDAAGNYRGGIAEVSIRGS